jgi:DNA-binding NarL/FixJ family response regulator
VVVDDHELVRIGLRGVLETVPAVQVVGEAGTIAQALELVQSVQPDIVLLDVRLPDGNGPDACRTIQAVRPAARVIMVSGFADDVMPAIHAGAAGYVLKSGGVADLLEALRVIGAGGSYLSPAVTQVVLDRVRAAGKENGAGDDPVEKMSARERRIVDLIADGRTNQEIAETLKVSASTVKIHVRAILVQLGMRHRAQVAAYIARRRSARDQ